MTSLPRARAAVLAVLAAAVLVLGWCSAEKGPSSSGTSTSTPSLRDREYLLHPDCLRDDLRRVCTELESASEQARPPGVDLVGDATIDRTGDGRFRLSATLRRSFDVDSAHHWLAVNFRSPDWQLVESTPVGHLVYRLTNPSRVPLEARMDMRADPAASGPSVLIDLVVTTDPYPVAGDQAPSFSGNGDAVAPSDLDQVGGFG